MHPDLSPHLHTPECNKLIESLKACHAENIFGKFIGRCNKIDSELWNCLKREREQNSAKNRLKAQEKQQNIRDRMQKLENTS